LNVEEDVEQDEVIRTSTQPLSNTYEILDKFNKEQEIDPEDQEQDQQQQVLKVYTDPLTNSINEEQRR